VPADGTAQPPQSGDTPFRSAEDWLADRGVRRDPIRVAPTPPAEAPTAAPPPPPPPPPTGPSDAVAAAADRTVSSAVQTDAAVEREDLGDAVARAVAFLRRSTAMHPASEQRLRDKLEQRDTPAPVINLALEQARRERIVDDAALIHALADERRAKGHAASRIRMDLRKRGFPDDLIDTALEATEREDPEAVAFGVARAKASSYGHLEPEAAFRRLVGYLARRGHPEGLARKVARQVVWVEREDERVAGH
jgi:regulatory protein